MAQITRTLLIALIAIGLAGPALADTSSALGTACNFLLNVRAWAARIVYVLGGIGLTLIAIQAFLGNFKWSWLFAVAGALFLVSSTKLLVLFITDGQGSIDSCPT